ncbi:MAG: TatD family hydrolase [Candidatus Eisenbacteria bacterium]
MIDTHAHVHASAFDKDRDAVLRRYWEAGGRALLEVNISAADWPKARELAAADPRIVLSAGIHPHDSGAASLADLERLFAALPDPKIVAIGETGLDYYRNYAPHDVQQAFFRRHVEFARESGLPLVVHARASHEDVLRILEEEGRGAVRGVLHCFSGDEAIAKRAGDLGFLLGFGGSVTYSPKKSGPLLRAVGLERMVLETDCPYLTPHPRRNDRNEPANIPKIAAAIADSLQVGIEEVERVTDSNAIRLFHLPADPADRA